MIKKISTDRNNKETKAEIRGNPLSLMSIA
jgi:hypothetical protein